MKYNLASSKSCDIGNFIRNKILKSKTFHVLCSQFEISPNRINNLEFEIKELEDNYAETDGSKMVLNKSMFKNGIEEFVKKYFFIVMHEIVHFMSRSKERDGYFNDPEEVLGFVSAIAYELESGSDLDDIWNKIYPKVSWHFQNENDAKKFFEEMLLKARKFISNQKLADFAGTVWSGMAGAANQVGDFYNRTRNVANGGFGAAMNQVGQGVSGYIQNHRQQQQQNKANKEMKEKENEPKEIDLILFYLHQGKYNINRAQTELRNIMAYSSHGTDNSLVCDRINRFLSKYNSPNVGVLHNSMGCIANSGPGQIKCSICGKYVHGTDRFCDKTNSSGRGLNSVFCAQHANEFGISSRC